MYDEDRINDSLEFVRQIKLYEDSGKGREMYNRLDRLYNVPEDMLPAELKEDDAPGNNEQSDSGFRKNDTYGIKEKAVPDADTASVKKKEVLEGNKDTAGESGADEEESEKDGRWGLIDLVYITLCVMVSFLMAYGFTNFVAHHTKVEGSSMNDTLESGDYLVVEKLSYYLHEPDRFDIVVFPYANGVNYIKRIIGLPGEKVQIIDGKVYINDGILEEDVYGRDIIQDAGVARDPVYLGEDEYFVLGDNRNSSIDSRRDSVGMIKRDSIEGKAVLRIWPVSGFGTLD